MMASGRGPTVVGEMALAFKAFVEWLGRQSGFSKAGAKGRVGRADTRAPFCEGWQKVFPAIPVKLGRRLSGSARGGVP